jgi:hypothetical protein
MIRSSIGESWWIDEEVGGTYIPEPYRTPFSIMRIIRFAAGVPA